MTLCLDPAYAVLTIHHRCELPRKARPSSTWKKDAFRCSGRRHVTAITLWFVFNVGHGLASQPRATTSPACLFPGVPDSIPCNPIGTSPTPPVLAARSLNGVW